MRLAWVALSVGLGPALASAACSRPAVGAAHPVAGASASPDEPDAEKVARLVEAETRAIDWLTAADPRLAIRFGSKASPEVLDPIGTEAVLAEDASARIRNGALDLFAFRARAAAIDHAAKPMAEIAARLPDTAPAGSAVLRPRLERELLVRLVEEEKARAADEAALGAASGDLVRGLLATWTPPGGDDGWQTRDAWVSGRLLQILASLQDGRPRSGPLDVDEALYPLERLLAPLEFPKGAAALARVRMALDSDTRAAQKVWSPESVAHVTGAHLGVAVDVTSIGPRLKAVEARLHDRAAAVLAAAGAGRAAIEGRARELLFAEARCPRVIGSPVRTAAPPPERAAVCGLVEALAGDASRAAAIVALHDDVALAFAAFDPAPPPRTVLLSKPDDDRVDALRKSARERPVVA
ncbi:MAG: hypothetical protein ACRENE_22725, partial [Polyangiaceae bacterium]